MCPLSQVLSSKWCLCGLCSVLHLLLCGVIWMSELTSLHAPLSKNHDGPTARPICLMACHQPCNEFTGCVLGQLSISVRQPLWCFPKAETFDASGGKEKGLAAFALHLGQPVEVKNAHYSSLLTNPPQHLSRPSAQCDGLFSTSMWQEVDFWKIY